MPGEFREACLNALVKFPRKGIFVRTAVTRHLEKNGTRSELKAWLQLVGGIFEGQSNLLTVGVEPFDLTTGRRGKNVITYALIHNFASMDAMIAATSKTGTRQ